MRTYNEEAVNITYIAAFELICSMFLDQLNQRKVLLFLCFTISLLKILKAVSIENEQEEFNIVFLDNLLNALMLNVPLFASAAFFNWFSRRFTFFAIFLFYTSETLSLFVMFYAE